MEFYNEKLQKARKSHKCHICYDEIPKGEQYFRESGKYDGEFFDRCTCTDCYVHRQEYFDELCDYEYDEWSISEYLADTYCSMCPDEVKEDCDKEVWHCPELLNRQKQKE